VTMFGLSKLLRISQELIRCGLDPACFVLGWRQEPTLVRISYFDRSSGGVVVVEPDAILRRLRVCTCLAEAFLSLEAAGAERENGGNL
jgi:hypothetical protein